MTVASHTFELQVADPPVGILFLLAMSGRGLRRDAGRVVLGIEVPAAGLGAASAQMVSYEAALGLTRSWWCCQPVALDPGHRGQTARRLLELEPGPVGALPFIFFRSPSPQRSPGRLSTSSRRKRSCRAASHRVLLHRVRPFLPGGVHGPSHSAIFTTLFLGGPDGPPSPGSTIGPVLVRAQDGVILYVYVWIRATLPRSSLRPAHGPGLETADPGAAPWMLIVAGRSTHLGPGRLILVRWRCGLAAPAAREPGRRAGARRRGSGIEPRMRSATHGARGRWCPTWRHHELSRSDKDRFVLCRGFKVTCKHRPGRRSPPSTRRRSGPSPAPPRPPRAQPLRGRDGEVHRLRAVRRRLPGPCIYVRGATTRRTLRFRRASATGSSTRSTSCAASTATSASRRARPRP